MSRRWKHPTSRGLSALYGISIENLSCRPHLQKCSRSTSHYRLQNTKALREDLEAGYINKAWSRVRIPTPHKTRYRSQRYTSGNPGNPARNRHKQGRRTEKDMRIRQKQRTFSSLYITSFGWLVWPKTGIIITIPRHLSINIYLT